MRPRSHPAAPPGGCAGAGQGDGGGPAAPTRVPAPRSPPATSPRVPADPPRAPSPRGLTSAEGLASCPPATAAPGGTGGHPGGTRGAAGGAPQALPGGPSVRRGGGSAAPAGSARSCIPPPPPSLLHPSSSSSSSRATPQYPVGCHVPRTPPVSPQLCPSCHHSRCHPVSPAGAASLGVPISAWGTGVGSISLRGDMGSRQLALPPCPCPLCPCQGCRGASKPQGRASGSAPQERAPSNREKPAKAATTVAWPWAPAWDGVCRVLGTAKEPPPAAGGVPHPSSGRCMDVGARSHRTVTPGRCHRGGLERGLNG